MSEEYLPFTVPFFLITASWVGASAMHVALLAPLAVLTNGGHRVHLGFNGNVTTGLARHAEVQIAAMAAQRMNVRGPHCSMDLTARMPSCRQKTQAWCWATSISELSYFYNVTNSSTTCAEVECSVVSADLRTQCCPVGSKSVCDGHGAANVEEVAQQATQFIGRNFIGVEAPLSEAKLVELLMAGQPVIMVIHYSTGGGHVMVIGGCKPPENPWSGTAEYLIHNPEVDGWDPSDFNEVLNYGGSKWVATVYAE